MSIDGLAQTSSPAGLSATRLATLNWTVVSLHDPFRWIGNPFAQRDGSPHDQLRHACSGDAGFSRTLCAFACMRGRTVIRTQSCLRDRRVGLCYAAAAWVIAPDEK